MILPVTSTRSSSAAALARIRAKGRARLTLVIALASVGQATGCVRLINTGGSAAGSASGASDTQEGGTTSTGGGSSTGTGTTTGSNTGATDDGCASDACGWSDVGSRPWCDTWTQDCPEGEKCTPWADHGDTSWNARKCVPIAPNPKKIGEPCTVEGSSLSGVDDCEKGAMCWAVDPGTLMGTCVGMCMGSRLMPQCADPEAICFVPGSGILALCFPGCDPLVQDCPAGDGCFPTPDGDDFDCFLAAGPNGGPPGEPCPFINTCQIGFMCAAPEAVPGCTGTDGCCTPFCDLTDPTADVACSEAFANPDVACVPYFLDQPPAPGHENVGVCSLLP